MEYRSNRQALARSSEGAVIAEGCADETRFVRYFGVVIPGKLRRSISDDAVHHAPSRARLRNKIVRARACRVETPQPR